jgi:Cu/Ag efflux pump CusA
MIVVISEPIRQLRDYFDGPTARVLPLAIGGELPGREIEGPMAIIILGGLLTSTALNLLVLPSLALSYGRFEKPAPE